eukprot:PhM_4_TR16822/c1_g1_i1/m.47838/K06961/KRR1; ribosomal RNA assembly protein
MKVMSKELYGGPWVLLQLAWFFAARVGDIRQVECQNLNFGTTDSVTDTTAARALFTSGKGAHFRKGAIIFLANCGVEDNALQLVSGHKRRDTLLRYLEWGQRSSEAENSALLRARAVQDIDCAECKSHHPRSRPPNVGRFQLRTEWQPTWATHSLCTSLVPSTGTEHIRPRYRSRGARRHQLASARKAGPSPRRYLQPRQVCAFTRSSQRYASGPRLAAERQILRYRLAKPCPAPAPIRFLHRQRNADHAPGWKAAATTRWRSNPRRRTRFPNLTTLKTTETTNFRALAKLGHTTRGSPAFTLPLPRKASENRRCTVLPPVRLCRLVRSISASQRRSELLRCSRETSNRMGRRNAHALH